MSLTHKNQFGMFIHWGIYALTGLHEQALARYNLDRDEYEGLVSKFNPTQYDPEKWVLLAKKVGMKYVCFTAKHHDGFCMWDTKQTSYNIMNTPYGKDVLKMLADACKKHGLLLSIYYSNPDWHHPYGYNPSSTHQARAKNKDVVDTQKYRDFIKEQIKELLTNYGPIYTFFWDIPPQVEDPSLNELIRELQPDIKINDRGWSKGDFSTPEREFQAFEAKHYTRMAEACNSVGEYSWGYCKNEAFFSKKYITSAIDKYMALGASYLLNVGPDENGVITPEYENRLLVIGDWYNRMEGCLESADYDSFNYGELANKYIATRKNNKTYIHFYDGIRSDTVVLKSYPSEPKSVRLMNTSESLSYRLERIPEGLPESTDCSKDKVLYIFGIDVDNLENEPIVIEIDWGM